MRKPRIAIIGGGIGGLTAARALLQRGFEVRVYEAAPEQGQCSVFSDQDKCS